MDFLDTEVNSDDEQAKIIMLDAFAKSLSRKRKDAVEFRRAGGIERVWEEDRDAYNSVDDTNRREYWHKPTSMDGNVTYSIDDNKHQGANVFIGLTQFYVDGCAARIIDMLTPTTGDRPFSFSPTPKSETLKEIMNSIMGSQGAAPEGIQPGAAPAGMPPIQQGLPQQGLPAPQGQGRQPQQPQGLPGQPTQGMPPEMAQMMGAPQAPATPPDPLKNPPPPNAPIDVIEQWAELVAKEQAEKAELQIWDWLEESGWTRELRECIQDMAEIGTGVLKGPIPYKSISKQTQRSEGGIDYIHVEEIKPGSFFIPAENIYPDPACGDDIHNGAFIWERGEVTSRQLKEFKGLGYIDSQIDLVLAEGPGKKYVKDEKSLKPENEKFEIWYYHGVASKEDMLAAGVEVEGDTPCVVVTVNDRVIKASINVLDSGKFPYDFFVWQKIKNSPWGKGVARIVRNEQRMLNGFVRNLCDNIALAAGPQIVFKRGIIEPLDGDWTIHRLKLWQADSFQDPGQIQHAMTAIAIPSMLNDLMVAIKFTLEMAEKVTAMPLMMQGDQGLNQETAQGRLLLQNNASSVLRRIAKMFDDRVIPHLDRYYEWLLIYGDDDCKGDFQIQALGSSSLYERDATNSSLMQMGQMVMNPAFGVDPAKWMEEFLKIQKIDPKRIMLTDEQKQQAAQAAAQNKDPKIEAQLQIAQLKAQGDMQVEQLRQQSDMKELQLREQIATTELQTKMDEADLQRQHDKEMMQMKYEMDLMQFSREQNMTLEQTKAKLAETAIKLKTQKELSQQAMETDLVKHGKQLQHESNLNDTKTAADLYKHDSQVITPPTEPVGRAAPGNAYAG
jgi:hypothetical protein